MNEGWWVNGDECSPFHAYGDIYDPIPLTIQKGMYFFTTTYSTLAKAVTLCLDTYSCN